VEIAREGDKKAKPTLFVRDKGAQVRIARAVLENKSAPNKMAQARKGRNIEESNDRRFSPIPNSGVAKMLTATK
jgi:hypothetical protein